MVLTPGAFHGEQRVRARAYWISARMFMLPQHAPTANHSRLKFNLARHQQHPQKPRQNQRQILAAAPEGDEAKAKEKKRREGINVQHHVRRDRPAPQHRWMDVPAVGARTRAGRDKDSAAHDAGAR